MASITLANLHAFAVAALSGVEDGEPLGLVDTALIRMGVVASVTALDKDAVQTAIGNAIHAGATPAQIQEVTSLVSGLGVHSLMATALPIARAAGIECTPFSPEQQALWDKYVGVDPFWHGFEVEFPGFLGALLRLSSDQFVAFFDYCAVPWKSGKVRGALKELIAMACDATPAHRFGPGFRLHLGNAIKLGVGKRAVMEVLEIAAVVPAHDGWD